MNKKAFGFQYAIIIGFLVGLAVFFLYKGTHVQFNGKIGDHDFYLINAANEGEKALLYIQQSAKNSLQQSIYDLAKNGGVLEIEDDHNSIIQKHECGKFKDAYVLYRLKKTKDDYEEISCMETTSINDNLKYLFNEDLNQYLSNYPEALPISNYDYEVKNGIEITGKAKSPLIFKILKEAGATGALVYDKTTSTEPIATGYIGPKTTKPGIPVSDKYKLPAPERRRGVAVDRIILHHTGDDAAYKTYNALKARRLSVHYIIDNRDGTIYYVVDESKSAQHAGVYNSRSIGIEIVNTAHKDMNFTDAQYASIKSLINDIAKRWPSITIDNIHVISHYQVPNNGGKWDPSPNFDWERIGLPPGHITLADLGKKPDQDPKYGWA
ncbi:N-acetylmuramoyl-L-alanine amidase [Candidatus Woesearchaeota archaeon]|nr:N-acetylmuramoyl-L-alanine amidase [Candidatus Woesearchaeota archaeon]